jgi:hypothetical protein
MKKLVIALLFLPALAIAQPRAFLVASYIDGTRQVCEYSDGSRFTISASARCAPVLY